MDVAKMLVIKRWAGMDSSSRDFARRKAREWIVRILPGANPGFAQEIFISIEARCEIANCVPIPQDHNF
jgi:hypothetical protein